MNVPAYKNPGRVLFLWCAACAVLASLLVGYDVALARYANGLREHDYRTYLGYAAGRMELKDFLGALQHIKRAKELAPERPEPFAYAGGIHYQQKRWEQAISNLAQAVENGDPSRGPRMDIVWSLIELKRYDEAAAFGVKYFDEVADGMPLLQYAAEAYLRGNRPEKAIPLLKRVLEVAPDSLHQLNRLAEAYQDVGDTKSAAAVQARITAILDALGRLGNGA